VTRTASLGRKEIKREADRFCGGVPVGTDLRLQRQVRRQTAIGQKAIADANRLESGNQAATCDKVLWANDVTLCRIEEHRFTHLDIGSRAAEPDGAIVDAWEVDEGLQCPTDLAVVVDAARLSIAAKKAAQMEKGRAAKDACRQDVAPVACATQSAAVRQAPRVKPARRKGLHGGGFPKGLQLCHSLVWRVPRDDRTVQGTDGCA